MVSAQHANLFISSTVDPDKPRLGGRSRLPTINLKVLLCTPSSINLLLVSRCYLVNLPLRVMFGFSSKRQREHGELADVDSSACHERKKLCPLPLRASPNTSQKPSFIEAHHVDSRTGLSTITLVESSDDDDDNDAGAKKYNITDQLPRSTSQSHTLRMGMEIDSGGNTFPSLWTASTNNDGAIQPSPIPNSLVNQSLIISERHDVSMGSQDSLSPVYHHEPNPEKAQDPASWQDQRLPSPVSESEDGLPSSMNSVSDVDMAYGISHTACSSPADRASLWQSSVHLHPRPNPVAKPRNKKATLSMGFRADCEKCHQKVPGHYSHIIRS
ncbi:uncharacterized protein KD926_005746 [Aspergillus affinis]|uniref:uncharacterized protein n=1 Tax=Aspergillus affinis TaxID=1070780 RepID=UPI0022FE52D6|nr:uncharacterized protein KD926_005746 [Aspergillus affinis]KAI9042246.1 hypothetical protein KD926_005746 [Aspergillus affinis]